MTTHQLSRSVLLLVVVYLRLTHAATDAGVSTAPPANTEPPLTTDDPTNDPFSPTTGAPADTVSVSANTSDPPASSATTDQGNGTSGPATGSTTAWTTGPVTTEPTPPTTAQPTAIPKVCLCDVTPGFCDVGCCCDTEDCGAADLSSVFNGCSETVVHGDCIERWLMFRANVDPSFVTVTDTLFCVRLGEDNTTAPQPLPALSQRPAVLDSHHFSQQGPADTHLHARHFYRVDDVILTQYNSSSARSLLRQPSPGSATSSCIDRNPAQFLRFQALSCTRTLTPQSCSTEPSLNAHSYFTDLSLLKVPVPDSVDVSDLLIPVTPLSDWPEPREQDGSCLNVVSKVEYVIGFSGGGELTGATVGLVLENISSDAATLRQRHSVRFQLDTPPTTAEPIRPVGLPVGTRVIGRFGEEEESLTVLGVSQGGECSSDPDLRTPILFTHNTITGCTFRSSSGSCPVLRAALSALLLGRGAPDMLLMNFGPRPDWTRVITQTCSASPQDSCESGCLLPRSLSVQVLWARLGGLALPQRHILGAKYLLSCQRVQCPLNSTLAVTTEVTFADLTVYPEAPRGSPQPRWKFPFGFFSRGAEELDTQLDTQLDSSAAADLSKVTWRTMLLMLMLMLSSLTDAH